MLRILENKSEIRNWILCRIQELRHCCNCHFYSTFKHSSLCKSCFKLVETDYSNKSIRLLINNQAIEVTTLYDWIPERNNALSSLMLGLKGEQMKLSWIFYANEFIYKNLRYLDICTDSILIPSPSFLNNNLILDHAGNFALGLGTELNLPIINCLIRRNQNEQKLLPLGQRSMSRFILNEKFSSYNLKDKKIIFIDDIVTTGFTSYSAYQALGSPKNFKVWALSYRLKL